MVAHRRVDGRRKHLGVIYNLVVLATVLLGAAKIGTVIFGVSIWPILAVIGIVSVAYSTMGGIRGTIYADFYLFAVIMTGAIVVMVYAVGDPAVGGFHAMMNNPAVVEKLNFFPKISDTDALMAVFIVPVAIQWWNVWYSGERAGRGWVHRPEDAHREDSEPCPRRNSLRADLFTFFGCDE